MERRYGIARIEAEHFSLSQVAVVRLQGQALAGTTQQKCLEEQLHKERERVDEVEQATAETRKKCRELEHQLKEYERRLEKKFKAQIPVEDVLALRRTLARQNRDLVALRHHHVAKSVVSASPPVAFYSVGHGQGGIAVGKFLSCWQDLRQVQTSLLLEQAGTSLVDLDEPEPEEAPRRQQGRFDALSHQSGELRERVSALLCDLAGPGAVDGAGTHFASVALTRFLRASASAIQRGPTAKVVVPSSVDRSNGPRFPAVVPVLADLGQLRCIHQALI